MYILTGLSILAPKKLTFQLTSRALQSASRALKALTFKEPQSESQTQGPWRIFHVRIQLPSLLHLLHLGLKV